MNRLIVFFIFLLVLTGPIIGTAIESATRPTHNDYPRYYLLDESLTYRVFSPAERPEWFNDEVNLWCLSEDFKSEQELQQCEYIKRINLNYE